MATLTRSPLKPHGRPTARHQGGGVVRCGLIALPAARCVTPRGLRGGAAGRWEDLSRTIAAFASAPHHGPVAPSYAAVEDADDSELHGSNQVALLALVPIGLMGIKWAISTGPLSLVVPAVLLAFPVVGGGLRQLLAEGVSMAVRCTMWMQHHQPPRDSAGGAADPHHHHHTAHHHHQGRTHHSHQHHQHHHHQGHEQLVRRSPAASSPAGATAPWAQQPHHGLAHHMPPAAPTSGAPHHPPQVLQRQPVGAWADVTVPLPASRLSVAPQQHPHPAALWPQRPPHAAALPPRGASPGRQPPPPPSPGAAHALPASRPATLAPPTPLQSLSDVQQCEDLDWEVSPQRQQEQHQANCPGGGGGAGGGAPHHHPTAMAAAVLAADDRRRGHLQHPRHVHPGAPQAPQHQHPHALQGPGFAPRHPPRGPAAS